MLRLGSCMDGLLMGLLESVRIALGCFDSERYNG